MSGPAFAATLLIEIICGTAGGLAVGRWLPHFGFGTRANALIGALGGLFFTWLAAGVPGVGRFVGYMETATDTTMHGVGGLTPAILAGAGIAGLLGGLLLSFLVGFARNMAVD